MRELARRHIHAAVQLEASRLRRLVIGEAGRRVPQRVIGVLAVQLQRLADQGLLRLGDAALAANQLAWLMPGPPLDEAIFCGEAATRTSAELDRLADAAVAVFLAAYRRTPSPSTGEFATGGLLDYHAASDAGNRH